MIMKESTDATDAAILNPKELIQNLESLNHPYAQDAIEFILSLVDLSDDMYVVLINEIGKTTVTDNYIRFINNG